MKDFWFKADILGTDPLFVEKNRNKVLINFQEPYFWKNH
jgi:hypothetical protein